MTLILRTRAIWTGVAGSPWYSNLFWVAGVGEEQQASNMHAEFLGALDAIQKNTVEWEGDDVVAEIESTTGEIQSLTTVSGGSGVGALSTDMLPRASQGLIHWRTGVFQNGREIRGRANVPGLTESASELNGTVTTTAVGVMVAAAALLVAIENAPQLCVWSRTSGAVPAVSLATVSDEFAVLTSRRD